MRHSVEHKVDATPHETVDGKQAVDGRFGPNEGEDIAGILESQSEYYEQRAPEYDEWFNRQKRFDWGEEKNQRWFDELRIVDAYLETMINGQVIEIACGTGNYTQVLASLADRVTAVDKSPEMLAFNRRKNNQFDNITYLKRDAFEWCPEVPFDVAFLSFWLSHIPQSLMPTYLSHLARHVRPGGKIVVLDQLREQTTTAADQPLPRDGSEIHERHLNDGRIFNIIKNFYSKRMLQHYCDEKLALTSWFETSTYFYCVVLTRVA